MGFFKHLPVLSLSDVTLDLEQWESALPVLNTALPSNPVDGQQIFFLASETNGVVWALRYRAASTSAHKWEFVGGGALYARAAGEVTVESEAYGGGFGPSITLPLAGDYEIGFTTVCEQTEGIGFNSIATIKLGVVLASDEEGVIYSSSAKTSQVTTGRTMTRTELASGAVLEMQYRETGGSKAHFLRREMWCRPVRVG